MNYNTYAGALLGTVFVVMTLGMVSNAIYHSDAPEEQGFAITVSEDDTVVAEVEDEGIEPIAPLMASADASAGESVFRKCSACHVAEAGGPNKVGPNLYNVVMGEIAAVDGFNYSSSLADYAEGKQWTYEELNGFLLKPRDWVNGTTMGFAGLSDAEDRANVIAWLREQSDNPAPLPDPAAGEPAAEESADAGENEADDAAGETATE
jgi:cytochrome c